MRKIFTIVFFSCLVLLSFGSHHHAGLLVAAKSSEINVVDGKAPIVFHFFKEDGVKVLGSQLQLPPGWSYTTQSTNEGLTVEVNYPTSNLPYYPQRIICMVQYEDEGKAIQARTMAYLYFTPYNTVEIWSNHDFNKQNRDWHSGNAEKQRVSLKKEDIPVSNLPDVSDEKAWEEIKEEDIQSVYVNGLAYSIPMLIDENALPPLPNSPSVNPGGTNNMPPPADGCGLGRKRWLGIISGRLTGAFQNDLTALIEQLPLEGLEVEVWDDDAILDTKLGTGYTGIDGMFYINVDECETGEGDELEIYLKVKANNVQYDIRGFDVSVSGLVKKANSGIEDWDYNNGNNLDFNFGDVEILPQAHKAVHLAGKAYRFSNAYSGASLPNGLNIRTDLNWVTAVAFFMPNNYCGVSTTYLGVGVALLNPYVGAAIASARPTIFSSPGAMDDENTLYHEFGHFFMWAKQNKCWINFLYGSYADYNFFIQNQPAIAWTEGFAQGYALILDAYYFNDDNESGHLATFNNAAPNQYYNNLNYDTRRYGNQIFTDPNTQYNGIGVIELIASTLLDLYDGPNSLGHLVNGPAYEDNGNVFPWTYFPGETDDVEIPFSVLSQVLVNGHSGGSNGLITNVQDYYEELQHLINDCNGYAQVKKTFDNNRVLFNTTDRNTGFSVDPISTTATSPNYAGQVQVDLLIAGINIPTYNYTIQEHRDVGIIDANSGNFNMGQTIPVRPLYIAKNLTIAAGYKLHLNDNAATRWYDSTPVTPNSNAVVTTCGNITLDVYGDLVIGDELGNETAELTGNTLTLACHNGSDLLISDNSTVHLRGSFLFALGGTNLVIGQDATLIIDNYSWFDLYAANLTIENGGKLIVRNNGSLHLRNNANVIVQAGGAIEIEGSGNLIVNQSSIPIVNLQANNSTIAIEGNLILRDGAQLAPTGDGFLRFNNPIIDLGINSIFELQGSSSNDEVLVLDNYTNAIFNNQPTARFSILNGKVTMGANSELNLSSVIPDFSSAIFLGNSNNYYNSVTVNGQQHSIENCVFRYGKTGLLGLQTMYGNNVLTIEDSEFLSCDIGLHVIGAGTNLNKVAINSVSEEGYLHELASQPSNLKDVSISLADRGIVYNGGAAAPLYLDNPFIIDNEVGVEIDGGTTLTGNCGSIVRNNSYGILAGLHSTVDLSNDSRINITQNGISLGLDLAYYFTLDKGNNDMVPETELIEHVINGTMRKSLSCYVFNNQNNIHTYPFPAEENHWNTQGGTPKGKSLRDIEDYELRDVNNVKLVVNGSFPKAPDPCGTQVITSGGGGSLLVTPPVCENCISIHTPLYNNVSLNVAVFNALGTMTKYHQTGGSDLQAIAKFHQILTYEYDHLSPQESELLELGYEHMKEALSTAITNGLIEKNQHSGLSSNDESIRKMLEVIKHRKNIGAQRGGLVTGGVPLYNPCNPISNRERVVFDEGHLQQAIGNNDEAQKAFNTLTKETTQPKITEMAVYWECIASKDLLFANGSLSEKEYSESVIQCRKLLTLNHPIPEPIKGEDDNELAVGQEDLAEFQLLPNPTQGNFQVQFFLAEDSPVSIVVLDALGKQLMVHTANTELSSGMNAIQLDLSQFQAGVYYVQLNTSTAQSVGKVLLAD